MNFVPRNTPVLHQPADYVADARTFARHIRQAEELMRKSGAAGIAFPQVGICARIFVSRFATLAVCVNPSYISDGPTRTTKLEGSMIVPGFNKFVPRWDKIAAAFDLPDGTSHAARMSGVEARVFQNLTDACDGRPIFHAPPRAVKVDATNTV